MTRWEVRQEHDAWAVVKVGADGTITYPRARWLGISCIDAQVIAAELNAAYVEGIREGMQLGEVVFGQPLGD